MARKPKIKTQIANYKDINELAYQEGREKAKRIKKYRQEVSRRASIANKRIKRLEQAGMTSSPAYQSFMDRRGGEKFSVRGKSYREVQTEMAEINRYLESATSSITGAKKVMREIASTTGQHLDFSDFKKSQDQAAAFFEIASKIEQYLRTVEDRASSIGYQKIWEQINKYVEQTGTDLAQSSSDMEQVSQDIVKAMKVFDETSTKFLYKDTEEGISIWDTVILDKDR